MTWLRLSLSRIEGQVHLKAILQDFEVVNLLAMLHTHSQQTFYFQVRKINSKTFEYNLSVYSKNSPLRS